MCREGGEASISLHVYSPIPNLFPLLSGLTCLFSSTMSRSGFVGVFFVSLRERLFLSLVTLLGRGVHSCNVCRSRSVFKRGRGLGGHLLFLTLADPRASPRFPGPRNPLPHSASRTPAATLLERDHTCAYSRFGGEVSRETREFSVPQSS